MCTVLKTLCKSVFHKSGVVPSALDKGLIQRLFYPLLLSSMLKCPFAMLKATFISIAYKH